MAILLSYSIKNVLARKVTSALTLFGVTMVVFVFCGSLMLTNGLRETLISTGATDNVVIIRKSSQTEMQSILPRDMVDAILADPAIATADDGSPLAAKELVFLINQPKRGSNSPSNISVRGVSAKSLKVRSGITVIEGRMWRPGTSEVIAGRKIAETFQGCRVGETVRFGARDWTVVGVYDAGGTGFDSEIWGDVDQLMAAFERAVYSSLTLKLRSEGDFDAMKARLEKDPRLTVDVMRERQYYETQSQFMTSFINILGTVISMIFSMGAIVGAMITMYGSVANRLVEIGTLRALGFSRATILSAFLAESAFMSLLGGALGVTLATSLNFLEVSTTNYDTFAEVAFAFRSSWAIVGMGMAFALSMGFIGGFLPAVRASRMRIVDALKVK